MFLSTERSFCQGLSGLHQRYSQLFIKVFINTVFLQSLLLDKKTGRILKIQGKCVIQESVSVWRISALVMAESSFVRE